jgi:hypothetical protein
MQEKLIYPTVQARSLWNTAAMQEQFSKRKTTTEEK